MSLIDYDEKGYVGRDDMLRIASFREPMLNIYDQKQKAQNQAPQQQWYRRNSKLN